MENENRVLGILPARAGSKGIVNKNIRMLCGKPLISWAAESLANSNSPIRKICCTDSKEIGEIARKAGLETPWIRPEHLANDTALVVDVIIHAIRTLEESDGIAYTHVALLQATSPTVTSADVDNAVKLAIDSQAETVITGFHAGQRHPSNMFNMDRHGNVDWFISSDRMARRQDMAEVFIRTGLVYVIKAQTILEKKTIYGSTIKALIIPERRCVTIDSEFDFTLAEFLLNGERNELEA